MKETIYLTRDESNIIKGILILLIVLGHNHFLMDGEYVRLQIQLYKFHVIEFFILPFFYKMKADTSWEHLRYHCQELGALFMDFVSLLPYKLHLFP